MAPSKKAAAAGSLAVVPAAKSKSTKAPKAKKAADPKKARAHPPYAEMITDAIVALKERTGSSQLAIAKFTEEKQKDLPANFKKLLLVQLKKLVAAGKLVKVKNSFKLAAVTKAASPPAVKKVTAAPAKKKVTDVAKAKKVTATPSKAKKVAAKPKASVLSPGKKRVATPVKAKKAAVKVVRKPKSIKSPAKKATAKGKK